MPVSPLLSSPERLHSVKSSPLPLSSLNHPPYTTTTTTIYTPLSQVLKHSFIKSALTPGGEHKHEDSWGLWLRRQRPRWGHPLPLRGVFSASEPLMQYCEEQAVHGSSVYGFRWGDISGAIKEMTGRLDSSQSFLERERQRGDVRSCLCAVMVAHPNKKKTTRCHRPTNRIYITHFSFSIILLWGGSCNWIFLPPLPPPPPHQLIQTISYSSLTWNEIHPAKLHSEVVGLALLVALLLHRSE